MKQPNGMHQENVEDIIALSPMQTGILFDCIKSLDQQSNYFEQLTLQVRGVIDYAIFQSAWEYVSDSNEMLRSIVKWVKMKTPVQVILKRRVPNIQFHDISLVAEESARKEMLEDYKTEDRKRGFDLQQGPLFRVSLCKFEEDQYYIVISYHHIILDGWSTGVILREFTLAYDRLLQGETVERPQKTKFKEYIRWVKEHGGEGAKNYWQSYLAEFTETTALPYDRLRLNECTEWEEYLTSFTPAVVERSKRFCQEQRLTLSALFYTAWGLLLQRYSSSSEILFGTPVSGRPTEIPMVEEMVGLFINTLPLRMQVVDERVLLEVVSEVQNAIQARQQFEHVSLAEMKSLTGMLCQPNLFDSLLVVENYPLDLAKLRCDSFSVVGYEILEKPEFDLMVRITPFHQYELALIYNAKLFLRETIEQLAHSMIELVKMIVTYPHRCVSEVDLVSEEDKYRLLVQLNQTGVEYPKEKTIVELFETVAEKYPERTALVYHTQQLTYRELNEKANQLARVLRAKGIGRDCVVGVMIERSVEMILGVLAIVKAGGAYLPIEPDYPESRVQYMLKDAGVELVLETKVATEQNPESHYLNLRDEELYRGKGTNLEPCNEPKDLMYIIYTSGSTGMPKGVMIEHRNVNRLISNSNMLVIHPEERILQTGSLAFDASTFEIWGSLLHGASLYLIDKAELLSADRFNEKMKAYGITMMWMTAPLFNQMVEEKDEIFSQLQTLIIGGDVLSPKHVNLVRKKYRSLTLINGYGPTESTTFATFFRIEREYEGNIPIGRPVSNTQVYVLNRHNLLQPFGVPGELCIAGDGLARGYVNHPELTAEKFVENPFCPEALMYRTGDLARVLRDGTIEFIGRKDLQVKIRGFRVEPGELEARLLAYHHVKEAVVLVREDDRQAKYLCAYLVPANEGFSWVELKEFLCETLPDYMLPSSYVILEKLPLNSNGKVDRQNLMQIRPNVGRSEGYIPPAKEIEAQLVNLWEELLGLEQVGVMDHFFELGGHSLKAMTLAARIYKEMNVEVPIAQILKEPTIRGIAQYIQKAQKSIFTAISPVEEREYYPLSSAQKRFYVLHQLDPTGLGYNMPSVWEAHGHVDYAAVQRSFKKLMERHESLRSRFLLVDGELVQKVEPEGEFALKVVNVADKTMEQLLQEFVQPFSLQQAPLVRMRAVQMQGRTLFLFDMHHIISDGISMGILLRDFMEFYKGNELPALHLQYKDFAAWHHHLLQSEYLREQEKYWLSRFAGELPILNLPYDRTRPMTPNDEGDRLDFTIDGTLFPGLQEMVRETGATLFMVLLALYTLLLAKYSGQDDIIIGTPIAGRGHADLEGIIGVFINTLAMRNFPSREKGFREFLFEVKENALAAYENQDYPFEELVEQLHLQREWGRNPLFNVMFSMLNTDLPTFETDGLELEPLVGTWGVSKFDLTLTVRESERGVYCTFQYLPQRFQRETIERFSRHLIAIAGQVVQERNISLQSITLLSRREREKLLQEFNPPRNEFPYGRTVVDLFEEQVQKTPEKVALVAGETRWTYSEWNEKANQLANHLRQRGIGSGQLVAIFAERNVCFPLGVMAILKAGAAYLPIEPDYPAERIVYMLKDGHCGLLLSSGDTSFTIPAANVHSLNLSDSALYRGQADNLVIHWDSRDLVYVIYTSGTTGKPKGVGIQHSNLLNYISWFTETAELVADDRTAILSSLAFDLSYTSFFPGLLRGCEIHLLSRGQNVDPAALVDYLTRYQITFVKLTPSLLHMLIQAPNFTEHAALGSLRLLVSGGEEINSGDLAVFHAAHPEVQVMNHYGPTETTIGAIAGKINFAQFSTFVETPSLGRPIANTQIYILDIDRNLVPVGVVGEIYIGGAGVALGYVHQSELTGERFIEIELIPGSKERVYKTGDLGKWLSDGKVQFLGRIDHQMKIRGYRVEIGEIEESLLSHPSIQQALVLDHADSSGEKFLSAYIVSDSEVTPGALREYLSEQLPDYMIPAYFLAVDHIPLTANGKVDRNALPEPSGWTNCHVAYEAPVNPVEMKLVGIWQEVLGRERVGVDDNFFELGGHSLKATILAGKIYKEMQVELPLKEIFKTPTVRGIAGYIERVSQSTYVPIPLVEPGEYYPLSSAQKRIFILHRFTQNNLSYNMPTAWETEAEVDKERLAVAFNRLIQRHEALRTGFVMIHGEPVQRVYAQVDFTLEEKVSDERGMEELLHEFIRPFDLAQPPLMRVQLVRQNNRHSLFFDLHHIISDGVSNQILIRELMTLYMGEELPEVRVQYKDFVNWQNGLIQSGKRQKEEEYWLNQFADEIPVLALPTDFPRPSVRSFEGAAVQRRLNLEMTKGLLDLGRRKGTTLYMTLLAVYTLLLAKYSSQEDIIVGSPIAGRLHPDLSHTVGIFINTLAIRNRPEGTKSFLDYLEEVKANTLAAFENQDYQFEMLVEKLGLKREVSRNPLFDTMFVLQNTDRYPIEDADFRLKPYPIRHETAKFDLTLSAIETFEGLELHFEYSTHLFTEQTIQRFALHMEALLAGILKRPEEKMGQYELILEEEKALILGQWNQTESAYADGRLLYHWLEEEGKRRPGAIAVICGDQEITYSELDQKTNQLARHLRQIGVKGDQLFGIMVPRSMEMLYGIFAILKAGGAYLPIDPNYPTDRVEYMLRDSQSAVLLTMPGYFENGSFDGEIIELSRENCYSGDSSPLEPLAHSNNLAYVIYTSGSTGNPKGVMIEHHSVINRLQWMLKQYPLDHSDTVLLKTPFTFDVSVPELFAWQMAGARLSVLGPGEEKDPAKILEAIERSAITSIHFVPSMLTIFLTYLAGRNDVKELRHLRYVYTSGEALQPKQVEVFNQYLAGTHGTHLINLYGPTETTVEVTYYECSASGPINLVPIGKPIANNRAYVVGPYGQLQPVGVPGELCIAGVNLARGYLNQPELTAEKFVRNPFNPDERMYRTGDLVRWLADGNIEFIGRRDQQVKIRGFRIELGEIEYHLSQHESVTEAVVVVEENGVGETYLCAYLVANREVNVLELREHLTQRLPDYMIPSQFIQLAEMPLTPNGKLNKKLLTLLGGKKLQLGVTYVAPHHEMEISIAALWKEILQIEKVGIDDNFFDLGGNSLQIVQVSSRLQEMLGREVPVVTLFRYPTIRTLVQSINEENAAIPVAPPPVDRSEVVNEGKNRMKQRMQRRREA